MISAPHVYSVLLHEFERRRAYRSTPRAGYCNLPPRSDLWFQNIFTPRGVFPSFTSERVVRGMKRAGSSFFIAPEANSGPSMCSPRWSKASSGGRIFIFGRVASDWLSQGPRERHSVLEERKRAFFVQRGVGQEVTGATHPSQLCLIRVARQFSSAGFAVHTGAGAPNPRRLCKPPEAGLCPAYVHHTPQHGGHGGEDARHPRSVHQECIRAPCCWCSVLQGPNPTPHPPGSLRCTVRKGGSTQP